MKKIFSISIIVIILLVLSINFLPSYSSSEENGIDWYTSYKDAFDYAKTVNSNVFVLITAPDWCGYCKMLEKNVLSKSKVIKTINENFVPLQILDTNPDKKYFDFRGYPSVYVYDDEGNFLADVYTQDPDKLLELLAPYLSSNGEEDSYSIPNWEGKWRTTWDDGISYITLTIEQNEDNVIGSYEEYKNGKIEGFSYNDGGKFLSGNWYQDDGEGWFLFRMSEDEQTFEGKWGYNSDYSDENAGVWVGEKID